MNWSDVSGTLVLHPLSSDGASAPGPFPLAVISHGNGGAGVLYRTLGAALAETGFVVALPDHPGNTRGDNGLARTVANLEQRPERIRRVIDWAGTASPYAALVRPDTVALIGHSMGGYTALALAGGAAIAFGHETPEGQERPLHVAPDPRVKALVLLAPATAWFAAPHALDAVRVPILMISAEHDEHTPPLHANIVAQGVPDFARLEQRIAAGAGHFSFLDPFPPLLSSPAFEPSQDPPGFDRPAFLPALGTEIGAFLTRVLAA